VDGNWYSTVTGKKQEHLHAARARHMVRRVVRDVYPAQQAAGAHMFPCCWACSLSSQFIWFRYD
jgi:hypothetical protein